MTTKTILDDKYYIKYKYLYNYLYIKFILINSNILYNFLLEHTNKNICNYIHKYSFQDTNL